MKHIDPDKVIYTRPYIPRWAKILFVISLTPLVIIMLIFLLIGLSLTAALL